MNAREKLTDDARHGTRQGYDAGCRCAECKAVGSARLKAIRSKNIAKGLSPDDPRHGTDRGYRGFNCRCEKCVSASALKRANRKVGLPEGDSRHGTRSGYNYYGCRCELCKKAMAQIFRQNRARKLPEDSALHGTLTGYESYGCRCNLCKAAKSIYMKSWKESQLAGDQFPVGDPRHALMKGYKAGCRCDPCKKANADHDKMLRATNPDYKAVRNRQYLEAKVKSDRKAAIRKRARTYEEILVDQARLRPGGIKKCRGCKKELPLADFYTNRNSDDGLKGVCKICHTEKEKIRRNRLHIVHWQSIGLDPTICYLCDAPFEHVDHVYPEVLGGPDESWNMRPACAFHNIQKHHHNPEEYFGSLIVSSDKIVAQKSGLALEDYRQNIKSKLLDVGIL